MRRNIEREVGEPHQARALGMEMPEFEALRRGLRELGYVEGQNLAFEYRFGQSNSDVLPQFAADVLQPA